MVPENQTQSLLDDDKLKKAASNPRRVSFLFGVFICLLIVAISNEISSLFVENNGLKGFLHQVPLENGLEMDVDDDQNKTIEFTGIQNAEWCVGKFIMRNTNHILENILLYHHFVLTL